MHTTPMIDTTTMINTISDKTALPAATVAVDGDAVGAARGHIVDSGEQV